MTQLAETSAWLPRRGTSGQIAAMTGEAGIDNSGRELVVDTSKGTAVLMHGTMTGGVTLLREDMANVQAAAGRAALGVDAAGTAAALLAAHVAAADPHPDYVTPAELAALLSAYFPEGDLPPILGQVTTAFGRALLAAADGMTGRALLAAASEHQAQYLAWQDYRHGLTTPPAIDPALWLDAALYQTEANGKPDFASFTRASSASYFDSHGRLMTAAAGALRHDHDPLTGQYLGWLIEEQRSNRLLGSSELGNPSYWASDGVTVAANTAIAPDGSIAADRLTYGSSYNRLHQSTSIAATAASHTLSAYVRADTATYTRLDINTAGGTDPTTGTSAVINFAAGTIAVSAGSGMAAIRSIGGGWYRVSVTHTSSASHGLLVAYLYPSTSNAGIPVAGASYWWGLQLEAGGNASSYIATTTSQATRAADLLTIPVSAFPFNPAEGCLLVQARCGRNLVSRAMAGFTDGTGNNRVHLGTNSGSGYDAATVAGGATQANLSNTPAASETLVKAVIGWQVDNFAACWNGGTVATDNTGIIPTGLATLHFGALPNVLNQLNGHLRQVAYFPRRLPNAALQDLTRL